MSEAMDTVFHVLCGWGIQLRTVQLDTMQVPVEKRFSLQRPTWPQAWLDSCIKSFRTFHKFFVTLGFQNCNKLFVLGDCTHHDYAVASRLYNIWVSMIIMSSERSTEEVTKVAWFCKYGWKTFEVNPYICHETNIIRFCGSSNRRTIGLDILSAF